MYIIYNLSCSKRNLNEFIDISVLSISISATKNIYKLVYEKVKEKKYKKWRQE